MLNKEEDGSYNDMNQEEDYGMWCDNKRSSDNISNTDNVLLSFLILRRSLMPTSDTHPRATTKKNEF